MVTAPWIEGMRGASVLSVAASLGLAIREPRGAGGGAFPCPACGAERRHRKTGDKRPAAGVRRDGSGWRCFQCDATGDAIDLVAYVLHGRRFPELSDTEKADVRSWCSRFLGLDPNAPARSTAPRPRPAPRLEPPPSYPPPDELAAFWARCAPVTDDPAVARWLRDRHVSPELVASMDLARVLPHDAAELPTWATFRGEPWTVSRHRLIVPTFDATGTMRSVLARSRSATPKSVAPLGYERRGLVMACPIGRTMLAHGSAWWKAAGLPSAPAPVFAVIAEGESDFLRVRTEDPRPALLPGSAPFAVFGIVSGAWMPEHAKRIPDGAHVIVATDDDPEGDRYASKIGETIAPHVHSGRLPTPQRWRVSPQPSTSEIEA